MADLLTAPDLARFMPDFQAAADRLAGQSWESIKATLRGHVRVIDDFETLESFIQWNVDWTGSRVGDGLAERRSTADGDMAHRFGPDFVYDAALVDPAWVFPRQRLPGAERDRTLCDVLAAALARTGVWHFAPVRLALQKSGHATKRLDDLYDLNPSSEHRGEPIGGELPPLYDGWSQLFVDDGIHRIMLAQSYGVPAIGAVIGHPADRPEPADPGLAAAITWLEGAERDEMLKRALPELREAEAS